jgi:hypothetical protein
MLLALALGQRQCLHRRLAYEKRRNELGEAARRVHGGRIQRSWHRRHYQQRSARELSNYWSMRELTSTRLTLAFRTQLVQLEY